MAEDIANFKHISTSPPPLGESLRAVKGRQGQRCDPRPATRSSEVVVSAQDDMLLSVSSFRRGKKLV